ncbi:SEL1-like repeat protein [Flavobacterium sp. HSC-61S13]|uniref:SEL1-like repeat protein n=1 Tax=Flavobacterium sp. HSC-61S13 TaxID=2910963 RepID=UPI0020A1D1DC|nr:SEL1-like repeat protein [Flavobacterium sp. HSC-61S13]MCP1997352.1 TPR repeat protein [Flavobacterium sp. HSC-61S13]
MAHRIYIYNIDSVSGDYYPNYLAEWKYDIPPLILPLFSANGRSKRSDLYFDTQVGIEFLKQFYQLLEEIYMLHDHSDYIEAKTEMFRFLDSLPYDRFQIDGSDVFTMNDEKPTAQAKEWVIQIQEQIELYQLAVKTKSLEPLEPLLKTFGYQSFLEVLESDWIRYGLGYWNEEAYQHPLSSITEKNGLKGLSDLNGNAITPAVYDEIYDFTDGIAVVQRNGKFGYLNSAGKEIVPTIYDAAHEVFDLHYGPIVEQCYTDQLIAGLVEQQNRFGLIDVEKNELLIPTLYSELELLFGAYFNAKKDGKYQLIHIDNQRILDFDSPIPFEWEYIDLFFLRINGSSKRQYYTANGIYLGDYASDILSPLPNGYYSVKPHQGQSKSSILDPQGQILNTEIDRLMELSEYRSFAFKKLQQWYLYSSVQHRFLLTDFRIDKIVIDYLANYFEDIYILETDQGKGIYDAQSDSWKLTPDPNYIKIEHASQQLLRIKLRDGMQYWDAASNAVSPTYDYISESIYREDLLLFLYQKDQLFYLTKSKQICEATAAEIGQFQHRKEELNQADLRYFSKFYELWKAKVGTDYYRHFDDDILYKMALEHFENEEFDLAVAICEIGVDRQHRELMCELGYFYVNAEDTQYQRLDIALKLYQKAADLGEKNAWNNLGYHYQNGIGCEQNTEKAIAAYTHSAALGNGLAWSNLAHLYYYGELVTKDDDLAIEYYLKAQKLKHFHHDKLADIYFSNGDYKKVLPLLKKDYEEEFSPIYYALMYESGLGGLKTNIKKALAYYEKALDIALYPHAVNRLLYHYRAASELAHADLFAQWLHYAAENNIEIDYQLLGIEDPTEKPKKSFIKKLFKK